MKASEAVSACFLPRRRSCTRELFSNRLHFDFYESKCAAVSPRRMESEESHSSGPAAPAAEHSIEKEAFMSLAHACPHQPLHYSYALTPSRCFGLFCSATAADQLKVEQQCLKCFSDLFPALAPHPSSLSSQIASPGHPQNQQRLQQKGEQGNADDEEGNADMPIEDLEFLWKRAARQVSLHRSRHVAFLTKHLDVPFSEEMMELAASRPWLIYWMVHGLALLEALPRATYADRYGIVKSIYCTLLITTPKHLSPKQRSYRTQLRRLAYAYLCLGNSRIFSYALLWSC